MVITPAIASASKNESKTKDKKYVETSWEYNGVMITVHTYKKLSDKEKKVYEKDVSNHIKSNSSSDEVVIMAPVTDGPSFTLIGGENKTFNNTQTYSTISSIVGAVVGYYVFPASLAGSVSGSVATGYATNWIMDYFNIRTIEYTKVRLGMSYSSYYGYYTYINSVVRYSDSSFSTPTEVQYWDTGVKCSDEQLAQYGLQNP